MNKMSKLIFSLAAVASLAACGNDVLVGPNLSDDTVDQTPPSVTISNPGPNEVVVGEVTISATASDTSGIRSVSFYVNDILLVEDSSEPFDAAWTPDPGSHTLRVVAKDDSPQQNEASQSINVTTEAPAVDQTPPSVAISNPGPNEVLTGEVTISATASDTSGIRSVSFYVNDILLVEDSSEPFETAWTPDLGSHTLRVVAKDDSPQQNEASQSINVTAEAPPADDQTPPSVAITNPAPNEVLTGAVMISATASDESGIRSVSFYVNDILLVEDSSEPFNVAWTPDPGSHTLRVVAKDNSPQQNETSQSINVTAEAPPVDDQTPPVVAISNPAPNEVLTGAVTITATASDESGIRSVSFYVDDILLVEDSSEPFEAAWTPDPGSHTLRVVAKDDSPQQNEASQSISVTAEAPPVDDQTPPSVAITNPAPDEVISDAVTITATASDESGIRSVSFYVDDILLVEDSSEPFEAAWTPDPGSHTLRVVAKDNSPQQNEASQSINVTVEEPPPEEPPSGDAPSIAALGNHEVAHGELFVLEPVITGDVVLCRKDLGHDDVKVDSETGRIEWATSGLEFGRGFHIRIKCSNNAGSAYAAGVVHVDKSGTSKLVVAGQGGVSPYIGVAGRAMTSGDTVVFPDGLYPVSVSGDASYENAFKTNAPRNGTSQQFSTLIAETPGGVVISGAPRSGIPKQKNAFQLSSVSYVAIVGMVVKDIKREAFAAESGTTRLLLDFMGTAGAGTNGLPCSSFSQSADGWCSKAGMRINGGTPLIQNSYDWGQNRYGIMTRSTSGSVTRRSFVRLDEHRGDQPYGGFSDYCDSAHLSQDNTVFDSLAIAAPFYKNYAGLSAYPATGCESLSANLKTVGLLAVNNDLSLSLMDQKAGPTHVWDNIVSYDSEGTCTPQTNQCGYWLLQADKPTNVTNSYFGRARGFNGGTAGGAFNGDINLGSGVTINDTPGRSDQGTPPQYLPESQLYFMGKSDTFFGDPGYDALTTARRWPIGGEDIIAENMRSYDNPSAYAVGGGTVHIEGDRGAAASNESLSEYFWGYTNDHIPPLVVRVKNKGTYNRVAWERHSSWRSSQVTGWKVHCASAGFNQLAELAADQLQYNDSSGCTQYGVKALYGTEESGFAYLESPE